MATLHHLKRTHDTLKKIENIASTASNIQGVAEIGADITDLAQDAAEQQLKTKHKENKSPKKEDAFKGFFARVGKAFISGVQKASNYLGKTWVGKAFNYVADTRFGKALKWFMDKVGSPIGGFVFGAVGIGLSIVGSPLLAVGVSLGFLVPMYQGIKEQYDKVKELTNIQEQVRHMGHAANSAREIKVSLSNVKSDDIKKILENKLKLNRDQVIKEINQNEKDPKKMLKVYDASARADEQQRFENKVNKATKKGIVSYLKETVPCIALSVAGNIIAPGVGYWILTGVQTSIAAPGAYMAGKAHKEEIELKKELVTKHVDTTRTAAGVYCNDVEKLAKYQESERANSYATQKISNELKDQNITLDKDGYFTNKNGKSEKFDDFVNNRFEEHRNEYLKNPAFVEKDKIKTQYEAEEKKLESYKEELQTKKNYLSQLEQKVEGSFIDKDIKRNKDEIKNIQSRLEQLEKKIKLLDEERNDAIKILTKEKKELSKENITYKIVENRYNNIAVAKDESKIARSEFWKNGWSAEKFEETCNPLNENRKDTPESVRKLNMVVEIFEKKIDIARMQEISEKHNLTTQNDKIARNNDLARLGVDATRSKVNKQKKEMTKEEKEEKTMLVAGMKKSIDSNVTLEKFLAEKSAKEKYDHAIQKFEDNLDNMLIKNKGIMSKVSKEYDLAEPKEAIKNQIPKDNNLARLGVDEAKSKSIDQLSDDSKRKADKIKEGLLAKSANIHTTATANELPINKQTHDHENAHGH
jgi:hypothetical protein